MAGRPASKTTAHSSVTTEVVFGRTAQSIKKAVAELNAATESFRTLESKSEDLALQVANKEEQIANLEQQFNEKKRQLELDLDLKMKSNAENVVREELASKQKIAIKREEYQELVDTLNQLKNEFSSAIKSEVGKAEGIAKSRFESELKLKEAEFKAAEASNVAAITSLKEKVLFLEAQGAKWEQALSAERTAGIERAKASAIGAVNVTSAGK